MSEIQAQLDYADEVARWLADLGHKQIMAGDLEAGFLYSNLAALVQVRQCRKLLSPDIEARSS